MADLSLVSREDEMRALKTNYDLTCDWGLWPQSSHESNGLSRYCCESVRFMVMILAGELSPHCYTQSLEHGHCGNINLRLSQWFRWMLAGFCCLCKMFVEPNGQIFSKFAAFTSRLQCSSSAFIRLLLKIDASSRLLDMCTRPILYTAIMFSYSCWYCCAAVSYLISSSILDLLLLQRRLMHSCCFGYVLNLHVSSSQYAKMSD